LGRNCQDVLSNEELAILVKDTMEGYPPKDIVLEYSKTLVNKLAGRYKKCYL
jgi:hypothetical protein